MLPNWPISVLRGFPQKANLLLDTTCFSTADFDDFNTNSNSPYATRDTEDFDYITIMDNDTISNSNIEAFQKHAAAQGSMRLNNRYLHPHLPPSEFLTTLTQPERFAEYIENEFPSTTLKPLSFPLTTTVQEPLRKDVNATAANTLLADYARNVADSNWIRDKIFPDAGLPCNFDESALDDLTQCWDNELDKFSNFPERTIEKSVQDWLNHLAHCLGVKHNLIQEVSVPESNAQSHQSTPVSEEEGRTGMDDKESGDETNHDDDGGNNASEDDEVKTQHDGNHGGNNADAEDEVTLDMGGTPPLGFVVANAEDRSFSMVTHNKGPSGGYRYRKPDLILLNRCVRHILRSGELRPRWHHVEAIVEVSASADPASMERQIVEKAALMFETQPFRRFVVALAIRGTNAKSLSFCFFLIDRSGVCISDWLPCIGYNCVVLARIVFALIYAKPETLGFDTSMTIDMLTGNVTKIRVDKKEYEVIRHIYASLILFGRGTHVFLVRDEEGQCHILKDAWLLTDHGLSEIVSLSTINDTIQNNMSDEASAYRSSHAHPRFKAGIELGDSTKERRGKLPNKPPTRVHRRVVTGPVGDPITSFRSRRELVQVLIDCVKCKSNLNVLFKM